MPRAAAKGEARLLRERGRTPHSSFLGDLAVVSIFVADGLSVIGFNPYANLAELIIGRAAVSTMTASAA